MSDDDRERLSKLFNYFDTLSPERQAQLLNAMAGTNIQPEPVSNDNIPCPWCGSTRVHTEFEGNHELDKWGYAICSDCSAQTGSIRTQYDASPDAPWRAEAIKEWNTRYQADERATNYPMQSIDDIPTEPAYFAPTSRATSCAFCCAKDDPTRYFQGRYVCKDCHERLTNRS